MSFIYIQALQKKRENPDAPTRPRWSVDSLKVGQQEEDAKSCRDPMCQNKWMHLEGGVGAAGNNIMAVKRQLPKATRAAAHEAMTAATKGKIGLKYC